MLGTHKQKNCLWPFKVVAKNVILNKVVLGKDSTQLLTSCVTLFAWVNLSKPPYPYEPEILIANIYWELAMHQFY